MEKYFVFWYPTIFHLPLEELIGKSKGESTECIAIDDNAEKRYYLYVKKEKNTSNTYDIVLCTQNEDKAESGKLKLQNICSTYNGFVVYKCETEDNKDSIPYKLITNEFFLKAAYHHSKSLYHAHEIHHLDGDSSLSAYEINTNRDIPSTILFQENNNALVYYLGQYEDIFIKYAKRVSENLKYQYQIKEGTYAKKDLITLAKKLTEYSTTINFKNDYPHCTEA